MRQAVVVDTNVILVANGKHPEASEECVLACVDRLEKIQKSGTLVIDAGYEILTEYQRKTFPHRAKGVGDVFVKWALQNTKQVQQVPLSKCEAQEGHYAQFPCRDLQSHFDPADRKFVAVSHAHCDKPPILQATDCKWLDWWHALEKFDVKIDFLCHADICKFYAKKFPKKNKPSLPSLS
jgi:hypothetical protein